VPNQLANERRRVIVRIQNLDLDAEQPEAAIFFTLNNYLCAILTQFT